MNTKTTKLLAVLAVFAMAFAGLVLVAPAEQSDATTATTTATISADTNISEAPAAGTIYGITASCTVNINVDMATEITFVVASGSTAKFNINATQSSNILVVTAATVPVTPGATGDIAETVTFTKPAAGTSFWASQDTNTVISGLKGEAASINGDANTAIISIGGDLKITTNDFGTVVPKFGIKYVEGTQAPFYYYAFGAEISKNAYSSTTNKETVTTIYEGTASVKMYAESNPNAAKIVVGTEATTPFTLTTTSAGVITANGGNTGIGAKLYCTSGQITVADDSWFLVSNLNGSVLTEAAANDNVDQINGAVTLLSTSYTNDAIGAALYMYGEASATLTAADAATAVNLINATGSLSYTVNSTTYKTSFVKVGAADDMATITGPAVLFPSAATTEVLTLVSGQFTNSEETLTKSTIVIGEAAKLTHTNNLTLSAKAVLKIIGTYTGAAAQTIAGTYGDDATEMLYFAPTATISSNVEINDANLLCSDFVTSTYVIGGTMTESKEYDYVTLKDDLVIPYGMTLTINNMLAMNEYSITVNGTLKIAPAGAIGSSSSGESAIILSSTGAIENKGTIGKNFAIVVNNAANSASYVAMIGVSGVTFGVSGSYLTISGTTTKISSIIPTITTHAIMAQSVKTGGDLTITNGVYFNCKDTYVTSGKTLTVGAGAVMGYMDSSNKLIVQNKGTVTVYGTFFGTIAAETFSEATVDKTSPTTYETYFISADAGQVGPSTTYNSGSVSGFTIEVGRVTYEKSATETVNSQRAYLSGTLGLSTTTQVAKSLAIVGASDKSMPVYVYDDDTLTASTYTSVTIGENGGLIVKGMYSGPSDIAAAVGVHYSITVFGVQTHYITDFGTAFNAFETVDNKLLTVVGYTGTLIGNDDDQYTIEGILSIPAGYTIAGDSAMLVIGEDAIVTVESEAILAPKTIVEIEGILVVLNGGSCVPTTSQYQVASHDADGNYTYASLATILGIAEDGDTIVLTGDSEGNDVIDIDKKVTVTVAAKLETYKLIIAEGATMTITSAGDLDMDCNKTDKAASVLYVFGTLDTTAGTFTMADDTTSYVGSIYSTGKLTMTSGQYTAMSENAGGANHVKIYGAIYTDASSNKVVTSATAAAASGKDFAFEQKYTSDEVIVLTKGTTMTVETVTATDVVTLAGIDISAGVKNYGVTVTATTPLTAIIYGKSGVDGAMDVEVGVVGLKGGFNDITTISTAGVTTNVFSTTANATAGSIYINEGIVTTDDTFAAAASSGDVFCIAEDAVLLFAANPTFTNYSLVTIEGILTYDEDKTAVDVTTTSNMLIEGYVHCAAFTATTTLTKLAIYGTLEIEAESTIGAAGIATVLDGTIITNDNVFNVAGPTIISDVATGSGFDIEGVLTIKGNTAYIASYVPLDDEIFASITYDETVLYLGDVDYLYLYATSASTVTLANVIENKNVTFLAPGYDLSDVRKVTAWTDEEGTHYVAAPTLISEDAFYFPLIIQTLELKTSWATGLSLYIDGVKMMGTTYVLDVGAHTVSAQVNAGYACDNMKITFNGVPVTAAGLLLTVEDDGSILALSGDVYIPEPEPVTPEEKSEWTITTILLVVLVILIAIMAVIVALRLNRS